MCRNTAEIKKVEIIERITNSNGSITENTLTSWERDLKKENPSQLCRGDLEISLQERSVKKKQNSVYLTYYEVEILYLLAKNPGRVFEKDEIYDLIWNEPYYGDYNVIMRHIRNIREKIEDDPAQPIYIQTVRGVGYRFNGNLGSK